MSTRAARPSSFPDPGRFARGPSGLIAALVLALSPLAAAQSVTIARANGSGGFDLWTAPESGAPAALELADVQFLPLRVAGAALGDRLRLDRPVPGAGAPATHVLLPQGGSLWLLRSGGDTLLLHVRSDGTPHIAATAPDAGAGPGLADRIAVSLDGSRALVATLPAPGGAALVIDLSSGGGAPLVLSPAGGAAIAAESLRVSSTHAFFVAGGVLHGSQHALGLPATPLALGAPGSVTLAEIALADGGQHVAAVTQQPGGLREISLVNGALQTTLVTATAGAYDTPNYDNPLGPWLIVSPDGSRVAWRGQVLVPELFARNLAQPAPPVQLTADAQFVDTIDNVGVLGFAPDGTLTFFAGELGATPQIGKADRYAAIDIGGPAQGISNLTLTSGNALPPFTPGTLELTAITSDPSGERQVLVVDPDGGDSALVAVPMSGAGPLVTLLPALAAPPELHRVGGALLVVSHPDLTPNVTTLHRLAPPAAGGALSLLATVPSGIVLDRFAADRTGTRAAFVASIGVGLSLPVRVQVSTGALTVLWPALVGLAPALTFTASGRLALGLGAGAGPFLFAVLDGPQSGQVLKAPVGQGLPLSF